MKAWFAMLPALALASLMFASGCGQSSTSVTPSETPSDSDYESDFEEQLQSEGKPAKGKEKAGKDEDQTGKN